MENHDQETQQESPDQKDWPDFISHVALWSIIFSAIPLIDHYRKFMKLFWFSDEIALLHEWSQIGFQEWMFASFGENVSPAYKIIWGGAVLASSGNYDWMVLALWAVHLAIVGIFALVLRAHKMSIFCSFLAATLLGICWSSHYLLSMSYHLNAGLCLLFALTALYSRTKPELNSHSIFGTLVYLFLLTCSVLSFSRGMVFAFGFSLYWIFRWCYKREKGTLLLSFVSLVPVAITLVLLLSNSDTTQKLEANFTDNLEEKIRYAITFFSINPLHRMLHLSGSSDISLETFFVFLAIKLIVYGYGLKTSKEFSNDLFCLCAMLIVVDFSHSLLLGYGRAGEGLETTLVSRYQRASLFSFTPLFALALFGITRDAIKNVQFRILARTALTTLLLFHVYLPWGPRIKNQVRWQGHMGREALLGKTIPQKGAKKWHGIPPHITVEQARATAIHFSFKR